MDKSFNNMNKEFEVLDLSPFLRQPKRPGGRGFTIKITRRNNQQPKVNVQTFGNVDSNVVRRELADEMKSLGLKSQEPLPEPAREEDIPKSTQKEIKPAKRKVKN